MLLLLATVTGGGAFQELLLAVGEVVCRFLTEFGEVCCRALTGDVLFHALLL